MTSTMPSVTLPADDAESNFGLEQESGVISTAERLSQEFDAEVAVSSGDRVVAGVEVPLESGDGEVVPILQEEVVKTPLVAVIIGGDPDDWDEKTLASPGNDDEHDLGEKTNPGMTFPDYGDIDEEDASPTQPNPSGFELYDDRRDDSDDEAPNTVKEFAPRLTGEYRRAAGDTNPIISKSEF